VILFLVKKKEEILLKIVSGMTLDRLFFFCKEIHFFRRKLLYFLVGAVNCVLVHFFIFYYMGGRNEL